MPQAAPGVEPAIPGTPVPAPQSPVAAVGPDPYGVPHIALILPLKSATFGRPAEAVRSGTPVLASRIDGNVGMLGADYAGTFEWNDAGALATLVARARDDPAMLAGLAAQCRQRAPLFEPRRERATLLRLLSDLLRTTP